MVAVLDSGVDQSHVDLAGKVARWDACGVQVTPELKRFDDLATTFLERFLGICRAMRAFGSMGVSLWNDEDGFFYDVLVGPHGETETMRVRSLVGLLPLLAVRGISPLRALRVAARW